MDVHAIIQGISIWALPVLFAVVLHEVAHGRTALLLGDRTAKDMGRLSLNPAKHIDPIGTIGIPLLLIVLQSPFLFGYAKPVPVNWHHLRRPRQDMVWVALAGPATNAVLAACSVLVLWLAVHSPPSLSWFAEPLALMAQASIIINVILCVFNLFPIPPLDGGRIATGLLPESLAVHLARLEPFGFIILVVLLLTGALQAVLGPILEFIAGGLIASTLQ
jgi:Zn-dependent protease